MNTKNLTQIFENYIDRFDWLTAPEPAGVDESYKWKAVRDFQMVFDLEADNFSEVLKRGRAASFTVQKSGTPQTSTARSFTAATANTITRETPARLCT